MSELPPPPSPPDKAGLADDLARASAVVVRDLSEDDLSQVAQLEHEIFGNSAWSLNLIRNEFRWGSSRWRGVDSSGVDLRGTETAGELAAYGVYGFDGDAFHLMNLAVAPSARGQGIGRALMDDFIAEARRLGVREAWLEVAVNNTAALALYRAYEFEDVRVRKKYYQPEGVDALVMRLRMGRQ